MRFQSQNKPSSVPEVNLVPMMDVLMSVLTFFIITSMSLTSQGLKGIDLPVVGEGTIQENSLDPLTVGINTEGEIIVANQVLDEKELLALVEEYLVRSENGNVIVKGDRKLNYQQVSDLLITLGDIGGDRVLLAIQKD